MISCSIVTSSPSEFSTASQRCYCWYPQCSSCSTCQGMTLHWTWLYYQHPIHYQYTLHLAKINVWLTTVTWSGYTYLSAKWWHPIQSIPHQCGNCNSSSCYSITPISALISCCIQHVGLHFATVSAVFYEIYSSAEDSAESAFVTVPFILFRQTEKKKFNFKQFNTLQHGSKILHKGPTLLSNSKSFKTWTKCTNELTWNMNFLNCLYKSIPIETHTHTQK